MIRCLGTIFHLTEMKKRLPGSFAASSLFIRV